MNRPPRALLISDGPGSPTGLGGQSKLVYEALQRSGWQVEVANLLVMREHHFPPQHFHANGMVSEYLVDVPLAADHISFILAHFQPDAIIALCDAWMLGALTAFPRSMLKKLHLWTTADHPMFPDSFTDLYESAGSIIFMADFGESAWGPHLKREGRRTLTIPHAVDPEVFIPRPESMFERQREALGTAGHFVALHVGRNQHRKQQPLIIKAWSRFLQRLPEEDRSKATLYLHTEESAAPSIPAHNNPIINASAVLLSGCNLKRYIEKNYPEEVIRTIRFSQRDVPKEGVAHMYNVADVHVLASTGEGFGVPLIEAQASGKANIAADNTTTPEIVGGVGAQLVPGSWQVGEDFVQTGRFTRVEAPEGFAKAPMVAPFGWRVPCGDSFNVQIDFSGERPLVDVNGLAAALLNAHRLWKDGSLNSLPAMARRRDWTVERYGWSKILSRWIDLLVEIRLEVSRNAEENR